MGRQGRYRPTRLAKFLVLTASTTSAVDILGGTVREGIDFALQGLLTSGQYQDLLDHGCWCAKASADFGFLKGGPRTVDELDAICKDWFSDRTCITLTNGKCDTCSGNINDYSIIAGLRNTEMSWLYTRLLGI